MVTGRIKLGAIKELSGKPLSCDLPESFFYAELADLVAVYKVNNRGFVAPNFSDNLWLATVLVHTADAKAQMRVEIQISNELLFANHLFYDNPSRKREIQ